MGAKYSKQKRFFDDWRQKICTRASKVKPHKDRKRARRKSSFNEPIYAFVKDVHEFIKKSDALTIRKYLGNYFKLESSEVVEFEHGEKKGSRPIHGFGENDFEFLSVIGTGGFGAVLKARRTSTGRLYALKIQPMEAMARSNQTSGTKSDMEFTIHLERTVLAMCRNYHFISSLEYAFHTQSFAILAMEYVAGGTLSSLISKSPQRHLPIDLAKLYVVEIALALHFMHKKGIIYRDLKPSNVLLTLSGHIKLTDFGLSGSMLRRGNERHASMPHLSSNVKGNALETLQHANKASRNIESRHSYNSTETDSSNDPSARENKREMQSSNSADTSESDNDEEGSHKEIRSRPIGSTCEGVFRVRRRTVCGTAGYRPPEQVQERYVSYPMRNGYDERADWFSLGVTTFVMIAGRRPFPTKRELEKSVHVSSKELIRDEDLSELMAHLDEEATLKALNDSEFRCLMHQVQYPQQFSQDQNAASFVEKLISRDPKDRLRYGDIRKHPWMIQETFEEESALTRPIPQWVKDHAYLQSIRYEDNEIENSKQSLKISTFIGELCNRAYEKRDSHSADCFATRWLTNPSDETISLFRNWGYISDDAVQLEKEATRANDIITKL